MKFTVTVEMTGSNRQDEILSLLREIRNAQQTGEFIMNEKLEALRLQVESTVTLERSAIQLITGISEQLAAVAGDPAKVQELADRLKVSAEALAAAVQANTQPEPVPESVE